MSKLGDVLSGFFSRHAPPDKLKLVRLWRSWGRVLGEDLADIARPVGHKQKTLVIGTDDQFALQELTYREDDILARVNQFLGENFFDNVRVELISGKARLDREPELGPRMGRVEKPRLGKLGGLVGELPEDSPVTKSYKAYVARVKSMLKNDTGEKNE